VPASDAQVNNVVRALRVNQLGANQLGAGTGKTSARSFVDLGSGDGRIVLAAGKHGFHGVGYELNPWLVLYSRLDAGCLLVVVGGGWWLVVGGWWLVVGGWWLVVFFLPQDKKHTKILNPQPSSLGRPAGVRA
jgi:hypothetical protein